MGNEGNRREGKGRLGKVRRGKEREGKGWKVKGEEACSITLFSSRDSKHATKTSSFLPLACTWKLLDLITLLIWLMIEFFFIKD